MLRMTCVALKEEEREKKIIQKEGKGSPPVRPTATGAMMVKRTKKKGRMNARDGP